MANFRIGGFPPVTNVVKNLIIINVLVFALTYVLARQGVDLDAYLALHYWQSPLFKWWQLITHLFMHGSVDHIFFNMFALYMFGSMLESVWGPKKFLIFYLLCGVGAAVFYLGVLTFEFTNFQHAFMAYQQQPTYDAFVQFLKEHPRVEFTDQFWSPQTSIESVNSYYIHMVNQPTVGASGAIFGLLFAFGYLFPNMPMMLMFIPVPVKAKWLVTGYGLIELFSGFRNAADDNVAHFAHLGGMLFAFILLRLWNNKSHNRFY